MQSNKTKAVLVWLSCLYAIYHFQSTIKGDWHFIDNVNLIIHEAGHIVFMPFGELITALGGSLLQILVPCMFVGYFYHTKQYFSMATMLLWVAINFFNVGYYAADAIRMELPLLGGDGVTHDWNFILTKIGLLSQAKLVAELVYFAGFVCVLMAAYLAYLHFHDPAPVKSKILT